MTSEDKNLVRRSPRMAHLFAFYSKDVAADAIRPRLDAAIARSRAHSYRIICASARVVVAVQGADDTASVGLSDPQGRTSAVVSRGIVEGSADLARQIASTSGEGMPRVLRSMRAPFAFVGYDAVQHELTYGNDWFGIYPLFVLDGGSWLAVCTEFEPLVGLPAAPPPLDMQGVAQYLAVGLPVGGRTLIEGLTNLRPASVVTVRGQRQSSSVYADQDVRVAHFDLETNARRVQDAFREAISARFARPERVTCCLTGGWDTRYILANLSTAQRAGASFLTVCSPHLAPTDDRDVIIASEIAQTLRLQHCVAYGEHFRAPDASHRGDPLNGTVGGWHGGELLGGYCFEMKWPRASTGRADGQTVVLSNTLRGEAAAAVREVGSALGSELKSYQFENSTLAFYVYHLLRAFLSCIYRGSASGWLRPCTFAARHDSVYWDRRFLEVLLTIPVEQLKRRKLYSLLWKMYHAEWSSRPTNSGATKLPGCIMQASGAGVEPKAIRPNHDAETLESLFNDPTTWSRGLWDRDAVMRRVRSGDDPFARQFIDLERWIREYDRVSRYGCSNLPA